jgi:hypothetical protein
MLKKIFCDCELFNFYVYIAIVDLDTIFSSFYVLFRAFSVYQIKNQTFVFICLKTNKSKKKKKNTNA